MVNSNSQKSSGRKLFYGLFIFPLLIAVGMAVLLCTVVLLTRESETPESLITAIKTGAPSKRWQKAFELSNEINQGRGMIRSAGVMKEVTHILRDRKEYDPRTRSYMAIALGRFNGPEVTATLREVLSEEDEAEVELHLIWALGLRGASEAVGEIIPFSKSEHEDLRKMTAYVLGILKNPEAIPALEPLLDDEARDVRWNAAVGLARLGSPAGYEELLKMADRKTLSSYEGMTESSIEQVMVSAVKGLALINRPGTEPVLNGLAQNDQSLKVRQAAIQALEYQKQADAHPRELAA